MSDSGEDVGDEPTPWSDQPDLPQTGDRQVDEILEQLASSDAAGLADRVEAFAVAHRALQDRLADLET